MNVKFVFFLVGNILIFVSPLPAVCAIASLIAGSGLWDREVVSFFVPSGVMLVAGVTLFYSLRKYKADKLLRRDGIGTVALSWIVICAFGALPFYLHGARPAEALFESVSGFTTTGSSIYSDIDSLPVSILLWRSLTQWVGGIGILVFLVALFSKLGIRGKALVGAESSVDIGSSTTAKIKDLAGHLMIVYLSLTLLCFLCLWITGWFLTAEISAFDALLYAMSTVSTGGFAPHGKSVAHYDSAVVEGILIVFMMVSSVSFVLIYRTLSRAGRGFGGSGSEEAKSFCWLVAIVILVVVVDLVLQEKIGVFEALRRAAFPIVSMASSTGFGTDDYDTWPLMSRVFLAFLMIIGGCGGSTAGGLKVMRFVLLLKILRVEIQKTFRPNLVHSIRLDGRRIDDSLQYRSLIYIVTVGFLLIFSTGLVSVMEPRINDFETAIGAVLGTFFNMGPGFGQVGPTDNFAGFHSYTLTFLGWLMLIGRLEIFVLLALFSPALWRVK